jgi:hypothetical protein
VPGNLSSLTNLRLNILATTADRMEVNLEPIDRKLDPHGQSMPFKSMCVGSWPDYDEHFWYVRNIERDEIKRVCVFVHLSSGRFGQFLSRVICFMHSIVDVAVEFFAWIGIVYSSQVYSYMTISSQLLVDWAGPGIFIL